MTTIRELQAQKQAAIAEEEERLNATRSHAARIADLDREITAAQVDQYQTDYEHYRQAAAALADNMTGLYAHLHAALLAHDNARAIELYNRAAHEHNRLLQTNENASPPPVIRPMPWRNTG